MKTKYYGRNKKGYAYLICPWCRTKNQVFVGGGYHCMACDRPIANSFGLQILDVRRVDTGAPLSFLFGKIFEMEYVLGEKIYPAEWEYGTPTNTGVSKTKGSKSTKRNRLSAH